MLPSPATATRDFARASTLDIFAEVYDNQTAAPHKVAIRSSVLGENGQVAFTAEDERDSSELQGKKGGYGYMAKIPLSGLSPGRYVLRVEAQARISKGATASRELEFRVR